MALSVGVAKTLKCKVDFTFWSFDRAGSAFFTGNHPKKAVFRCQIGLQTNRYEREQLLNS